MTIARSLSDTFAGIRPADAPLFIVAQLAGALSATFLFGWLVPSLPTHAQEVLVPHPGQVVRKNGGDDETRTRDLCRDSWPFLVWVDNFRFARHSQVAHRQREVRFLFSAGRRSAHFRMASSVGQRDWPHDVRRYATFGGIGRPHNDSVRCQTAELLPQHFLSDVGYRSFQIGKAHHLASE